ncbi:hypothetical protein CS542_08910 [Pedobacter sp. IW39]|nr:hypothetical protein CS542_08910 [Pedobacter sp. IW39]
MYKLKIKTDIMKENEYTQEERNAFKEEIERTAILEQSITNVLSQHHEVYLADDKFVLNFTDFQGEKTVQ